MICKHEAWEQDTTTKPLRCADCKHVFSSNEQAARWLSSAPEPSVSWDSPEDKARFELIEDLIRILDDFAEDYPDRETIMKLLRKRSDELFSLRA